MTTIVEYFSEVSEPYPRWLYEGDYSLRNFFRSRTVFYPGVGADGRPLDIFNPSHSAHCYFFVDQRYSAASLDRQTGDIPTGSKVIHDNQFSVNELKQESISVLLVDNLRQFSTLPRARVVSSRRDYRSQDGSVLAAADSVCAVRLPIWGTQPGYLAATAIVRRGGSKNFDRPSLFAHATFQGSGVEYSRTNDRCGLHHSKDSGPTRRRYYVDRDGNDARALRNSIRANVSRAQYTRRFPNMRQRSGRSGLESAAMY